MERTATFSDRRAVVRGLVGFIAGGAALTARPAAAARGWCRMDPIIVVDCGLAEILVAVKVQDVLDVNGPTEIVVTVPVGVEAGLAADQLVEWRTSRGNLSGPGFRYGEFTRFAESRKLKRTRNGIHLEVAVRVPSRGTHRVRVEFGPAGVAVLDPEQAKGATNEWVTLATTFKPRRPTGGYGTGPA